MEITLGQRLELHAILLDICEAVYFQPPENLKMAYPCIVYQRNFAKTSFANNVPYSHTRRYQVICIGQDPDSTIYDQIAALPMCVFERHYVADNLNHDVFNLFF